LRSTSRSIEPPVGALELERKQGCQDGVVIGGLGNLLAKWAQQEANDVSDPERQQRLQQLAVHAQAYADLTRGEREQFVAMALALAKTAARSPRRAPSPSRLRWETPVTALRGVGERRAALLAELGIRTVGDLLTHFPLRHEDRRTIHPVKELRHRQTACVEVRVTGQGRVFRRGRRQVVEVPATDGADALTLVWFNQPYRAEQFPEDTHLIVTGQPQIRKDKASLIVTELEQVTGDELLHTGRLVPIYPLTEGVSQVFLRGLIAGALEQVDDIPPGAVPAETAQQRGLIDFNEAIRAVHFPPSPEAAEAARKRLAYEELYLLQALLAHRRGNVKRSDPESSIPAGTAGADLAAALPFELTAAQQRVIDEVLADLADDEPAYRLVHGDVGSGKTVVAAAALLATARAARQAAMMVPTELLAEQHHGALSDMLAPLGVEVVLLSGSMSEAAKSQVRESLDSGRSRIVVGTHALFQRGVRFADLALAIVDEQHRFGVRQRAELSAKGSQPNVLVMSATPIPRTLALTAYGDFDVSVLDELPPGRRPVHTELITGRDRHKAYDFIIKLTARGRQAYIVCPLIEETANEYVVAAERHFHRLKTYDMPTLRLGLVHGGMEADRRQAVMDAFRAGELDVLVATSVVEVGVDVPNATVMMVENAERFGLSQLHQLRGRVGRGHEQAYCLLVSGVRNPDVIERLQMLVRSSDGFEIAREDLRRRGPGELAGTRQHGLPDLRMADLLADTATLAEARQDAFAAFERDPELRLAEHVALREALAEYEPEQWAL